MRMDGPDAFTAALKNRARKYPDREDARFDGGFIFPAFSPGFRIAPNSSVFAIGSCFARNVEEVLVEKNVDVPTAHFVDRISNMGGRPNRVLNQFNPATMLRCVETAGKEIDEKALYRLDEDKYSDCLIAATEDSLSHDDAMKRRQEIADLYRVGLAKADTVIVTLGLIEAWYDLEDEVYLNKAPSRSVLRANPERFEFRRLEVAECEAMLFRMIEMLLDGGRRNMVLTVSPVPLQATFTGVDCVVANSYSKSVLRVIAERARETFANVDYFPSYEMVTSSGFRSFQKDNVHVRGDVVEGIVTRMVAGYVG